MQFRATNIDRSTCEMKVFVCELEKQRRLHSAQRLISLWSSAGGLRLDYASVFAGRALLRKINYPRFDNWGLSMTAKDDGRTLEIIVV